MRQHGTDMEQFSNGGLAGTDGTDKEDVRVHERFITIINQLYLEQGGIPVV